MSVRPSARMEQLGSHWTDSDETGYFKFVRKSVEKIQVSLKSDENNEYFTWTHFFTFMTIYRWVLLRMRNVSNKSCRRKTCFVFSTFFFSDGLAAYEIMSKNVVETERLLKTIWRRVAWRIRKATRAQEHVCACALTRAYTCTQKYVILIAFLRHQWFRERAWMLRHTYIACLVEL